MLMGKPVGITGSSLILGEDQMGSGHISTRGEHPYSVLERRPTVGKAGSTQLRQTESEVKSMFQRDAGGRGEAYQSQQTREQLD